MSNIGQKSIKTLLTNSNLSKRTIEDIETAYKHGYDAIGEFYYNPDEKSVLDLIQFAQSLAIPAFVGNLLTKENWAKIYDNYHANVINGLEPYNINGEYNSYSLGPSQNKTYASKPISPLRITFSRNDTLGQIDENIDRINKIWSFFEQLYGIKVVVSQTYGQTTCKEIIGRHKQKEGIQINLNINSNNYEAFVIACDYVATKLLSDNKTLNENELIVAKKLLVLGLARSFDLGKPQMSYKLDEALKLDFFTSLGLLNGQRKDCIKKITNAVAYAINSIKVPDGFLQKIVENLENMGFVVPVDKTTLPSYADIVFGQANILKKISKSMEDKFSLTTDALSKAAVGTGSHRIKLETLIDRIRDTIPGTIGRRLFTPRQEKERDKTESIPVYAVGQGQAKYLNKVSSKKRKEMLSSQFFQRYLDAAFESAVSSAVQRIEDWAKEEYALGRRCWTRDEMICAAFGLETDRRNTRLIARSVLQEAVDSAVATYNKGVGPEI